ncbi:MAG: hypothetical protein HXK03_07375, partial [Schaalia georgiae]|nr:hypothetical protein [Schaalia georgiae]
MSNDDVWKRIEHAQFLIDIKRPQQAIEQLVRIPQGDLEVAARVNCTLAQAHLLLDQKDKAYACARRAIEASPNDVLSLYWLSTLEPDSLRALEHATRLVEMIPDVGIAHAVKARALALNRRWDEALNAAREGERLDPEDSFV